MTGPQQDETAIRRGWTALASCVSTLFALPVMAYSLWVAAVLTGSFDFGQAAADPMLFAVVFLLSPLGAFMLPQSIGLAFLLIFLAASVIVRNWQGEALQLRWPWVVSGALLGGVLAATLDPMVAKSAGLFGKDWVIVAVGAWSGALTMLFCRNQLRGEQG